ncbi:MAG: thioredoxin [Candidatus Latescibacteria bacterium]|nr:thioredoxin [Candidatus Latescibacterota bacterium]
MAIEFNEANFQTEVLDSPIPVLVDFWASWCMPCQMVTPVIEQIAAEYQGKLKVGKVNVDNEANLAQKYQIMSIPALLFFKNGQIIDTVIGAVPKGFLIERINKIIQ